MPKKNSKINIMLDEPMRKTIERLAIRDKVSLSQKTRDLLKLGLEIEEDIALTSIGDERSKTLKAKKPMSHKEAWRQVGFAIEKVEKR